MGEPVRIGIVGLGRIGMSVHKSYYQKHPEQ